MPGSAYYPEWLPETALCQMEGHDYGFGGSCRRCGARLRCSCGRFIRVDTCEQCPCLNSVHEEASWDSSTA